MAMFSTLKFSETGETQVLKTTDNPKDFQQNKHEACKRCHEKKVRLHILFLKALQHRLCGPWRLPDVCVRSSSEARRRIRRWHNMLHQSE